MGVDSTQHCEQTLMFTDIVGYSRLMGRNESLAVEMLGDYRKILLSHIEAQGGHLVEFVGDAIFARFDTATAAVAAAIAIQQHLLAFNEARDKKLPRLQTRIGLNKGEVMLREGAVFGDAVNIAARLEPLAVADGICISQSVYDEVRFSLSSPAKRLGVQPLKNIQQKIRVYFIKPAGIGWRDHLHYFLRGLNRKIVACRYPIAVSVLALIAAGFYFIPRWLVPGYAANYVEIADFKNLMNEKGDADYFSAGITEAVRSQLADMRDVYIVDAKEGIHAPIRLEGSVQKLGDNLRIAYRLFRRKDNVQIAGGKLDGTYQDIFILQDRLVGEIARYLADEFQLQNFRPAPLRLTNDITAYDYYLKGLDYLELPATQDNADQAIKNFNTALIHDNKFSLANVGVCNAYWKKFEITRVASWLKSAENFCLAALAQDPMSAKAYKAMGAIYRDFGQYRSAIKYLERGREIDRYDVTLSLTLAAVYNLTDEKSQAEKIYLDLIKQAPKNWRVYSGYANFLMRNGRHDEAIGFYDMVLDIDPNHALALNNMAINYVYKNDFQKAARFFERSANVEPNSSVFVNTGNMYYSVGDFEKAVEFYDKALRLQPESYQLMVNLADAYKFMPEKKLLAEEYFKNAIRLSEKEIAANKNMALAYQYLARSYAFFGRLNEASEIMKIANELDSSSAESCYTNLRLAVLKGGDHDIKKYVDCLRKTEYSVELLLSDPDFSILKESRFKGWFLN
ncbi:tetratricopeptide repeat protein [Cellvibrio sp. KY-GH-1]|uniref:tetratricopeptide repeat protein n=1 Tax=Cellvibrio sp. KY-GH-1 TaxID=2303332 RepID=UPI0012449732|nr:tetratricopeptide repeat protein [Cellvibrio sp. KY-GH-1]QEY18075.1 tetratricopeptide repeat protein [Cellvibrio sp. KY-GH-1]